MHLFIGEFHVPGGVLDIEVVGAILKSGGISTHYRYLLGMPGCVLLKLTIHSLMKSADMKMKDLEVSHKLL